MKKSAFIFITVIFMTLAGCQNNGDIGRLFGTWALSEYTVNGEKIEELEISRELIVPLSHITFSFQSEVVGIATILDNYNSYDTRFGTWEEDGDTFTFNFTHYDSTYEPGTGKYQAPPWLGMTSDGPMVMKVSDSKSRSFTLTWNDPRGYVRVYKLHKTW